METLKCYLDLFAFSTSFYKLECVCNTVGWSWDWAIPWWITVSRKNDCDEKINFHSFRSAELLSLFWIPIYLQNPCNPRYISKYISNYFPPDKYWHSFTYKPAAHCWSKCLILQTKFTHNGVNTNMCYLIQ